MLRPIKVTLGPSEELTLKRHLKNRVMSLRDGWRDIHENRLPRWRKIYEAIPKEETREFPWHNASNIVVPIVGIHCDTLLAWIMSGIFKTKPMWSVRALGRHVSKPVEPLRNALETFLEYVGMEPEELDLYRVYEEWIGQSIRYGTATLKAPWEYTEEDYLVPAGDDAAASYAPTKSRFESRVVYDGPRPELIPYEDFLVSPIAKRLEAAPEKIHVRRLERWQLQDRGFRGIYPKDKLDKVLGQPDRTSALASSAEQQADTGAQVSSTYGFQQWDLNEFWLRYRFPSGVDTRIIATYHEKSDTLLRCVYNQYPDDPFVAARLFYRDGMYPGMGFCEMLCDHQNEISEMHNQRRDRMTAAFSFFRVAPDSKLHSGYRIYPTAMVPAEEGEIEQFKLAEPGDISIEEEKLALEEAERRSGVRAPQQGAGSGTFNKRGVYSSQGTLAVMQDGNTRTDLNVSDIRYAHTKVGRLMCKLYHTFGKGGTRYEAFGQEVAGAIQEALAAISEKRITLAVASSTASLNREVEKQNDLMLANIMGSHYERIAGMLSQANNPAIPPEMKEYIYEAVRSSNELMEMVLMHFGQDEAYRLVPEPRNAPTQSSNKAIQDQLEQQAQAAAAKQQGGGMPVGAQQGGMPGGSNQSIPGAELQDPRLAGGVGQPTIPGVAS
jgi:hypothetical protein